MAKQRVVVVGGGLAGLAATMKLAEFGVAVDLLSMVPVKRSHSVCAQGGINAVNHVTRALGDSEYKHFDDTVYGGAFLQHQPPVKEMCDWGERICDLMDRIGAYLLERSRRILQAGAGQYTIFEYNDDVASQRGLFISPDMWRRYIKPRVAPFCVTQILNGPRKARRSRYRAQTR